MTSVSVCGLEMQQVLRSFMLWSSNSIKPGWALRGAGAQPDSGWCGPFSEEKLLKCSVNADKLVTKAVLYVIKLFTSRIYKKSIRISLS